MDYCSQVGLTTRFGELLLIRLTDDTQTAVDGAAVAAAITAVNGEIDGYLRDRFTLPLPEIPPELEGYAEDMTLERIYSRKPERETPKDVKDRAAAARSWLRDVKRGLTSLSIAGLSPAPGTNDSTGSGFFKTSKTRSDRIFSDQKLDTFTR